MIGGFSNDFVLLLLNRGNDLAQNSLFVFGKILHQKIIVGYHFRVHIIEKPAVFYFEGSFKLQIDRDLAPVRGVITAIAEAVFVIGVGNRCSPVDHDLCRSVLCNAAFANVEGFCLIKLLIPENDSAEIGLVFRPFVSMKRTLHVLIESDGIV